VGAGQKSSRPPLPLVEGPDQDQETIGRGVEMGGEAGDLVAQGLVVRGEVCGFREKVCGFREKVCGLREKDCGLRTEPGRIGRMARAARRGADGFLGGFLGVLRGRTSGVSGGRNGDHGSVLPFAGWKTGSLYLQ
jgi:hypothetical protein